MKYPSQLNTLQAPHFGITDGGNRRIRLL